MHTGENTVRVPIYDDNSAFNKNLTIVIGLVGNSKQTDVITSIIQVNLLSNDNNNYNYNNNK